MTTAADSVDRRVERLHKREELRRFVVTGALSILVHLLVFLLFTSSVLDMSPAAEPEQEEIVVPLELEQPPPPEPAVEQTPPAPVEQPPEEQGEEKEQPEPEQQELIGWQSKGDEPGRQVKPPGPETDVHAPPEPSEESGTSLDPSELDDAPEGPDETRDEPAEELREPREGPAEEIPEPIEESPVDREPEPEEEAPRTEPEPNPVESRPPGELFPEAPPETPDDPATPTRESEPVEPEEPEVLPLPTPPVQRPRDESRDEGGISRQIPGFEAEIQGGYFNNDLKFDSKDYKWQDYATKLYFAIRRAWLRELHGRVRRFERDQALQDLPNLDGRVAIHFVIHRDGSVSRVEVVGPSQLPALDEASSAALKRLVPPPLPDDFPRDQEGATFSFELRGFRSAQQLEMRLDWSRRNGEF